jgi:hypothetical protein
MAAAGVGARGDELSAAARRAAPATVASTGSTGPSDPSIWVVREGDFLTKIAVSLGRDREEWRAVRDLNLGRPRRPGSAAVYEADPESGNFLVLEPGDELLIPPAWLAAGRGAPATRRARPVPPHRHRELF